MKKKHLCPIILVVLLLSNWIVFVAHTAELKIEKTLTEAEGLASNTVLTIFEDSHGAMWFGTTDGITRYDGKNFQTFTTEDGLAQNTIGLIFEDQRGMLWFADGVLSSFLERGKPIDVSWMETPLSELDLTLHNETPERMTRRIRKGVSRYDGEKFRVFTIADGLAGDTVTDIFEDETGTLWFATSFGVSHYDGETFNTITMNGPMGMQVLPEWWSQITAIAQDTAGNFWFGSTAGVTYYNVQTTRFRHFAIDGDFTPFQEMGKAQTAHITDLQFDANDNLWMSQQSGGGEENSGIRRFNGKKLAIFPQSEQLPMNSVDNIMQDKNGNLWFTGVKNAMNLPPMRHETEDSVSLVFPEAESSISVYNGKTFQNFNTADGLPSNRVWSVFEDSRGKLWFATDAGAAVGVYLSPQKLSN